MTGQPHEDPRFYNAVEYTVAITFTVRGGKRYGTADRQARKIADRLASRAARMVGVVEARATAGPSRDGEITSPRVVRFEAANTGHAIHGEPNKLDRYLDPEHELALRSLAADNASAEQRRHADRDRRRSAGCHNTYGLNAMDRGACECVYCDPDEHYLAAQHAEQEGPSPFFSHRCLCGVRVAAPGERCLSHRGAEIVVLDGDPSALHVLAEQQRRQPPRHTQQHHELPEQDLEL